MFLFIFVSHVGTGKKCQYETDIEPIITVTQCDEEQHLERVFTRQITFYAKPRTNLPEFKPNTPLALYYRKTSVVSNVNANGTLKINANFERQLIARFNCILPLYI